MFSSEERADSAIIKIISPAGAPVIRIESAENLPGGYIIVPLGESQEDGVSVHTFKLKTAHNIGPDRDFRLVVNNVFEDNNPHLITVKQKGYFTPME